MSIALCTEEVQPIADKLVNTYPTNLVEVDTGRILFLRGNGKRRPVTIASVRSPWDLCTKYKFVLTIHGPKYDSLDENKQAIAIFDELLRIKDFESGSLNTHSVVGNHETLSTWGFNWLEEENLSPIFKTDENK